MTQIQTNVSLILVPEVKLNFSATNPPGGTVRFMQTDASGNLVEVASETNPGSTPVTASTSEGPSTARILVAYLDDGSSTVTEANKGKGHGHSKH